MGSRRISALGLAALFALGAAASASARTVSYRNVVSPSKLIHCYAVQNSSRIECTAPYLARIGELDPYLALRPTGRAILSERGDYPGYSTPRRTLRYGDVWARPGIRCVMRTSGLRCRNRSGHGFRIARGHVGRF